MSAGDADIACKKLNTLNCGHELAPPGTGVSLDQCENRGDSQSHFAANFESFAKRFPSKVSKRLGPYAARSRRTANWTGLSV